MTKYLVMLGAFLLSGLGLWRVIAVHDNNLLEDFKRESKVKANDSTESVLKPQSDSLRVQYIEQKVPYIVYRDRAVATYPKDTTVQNLVRSCNQLIVTCEERQRVDSARISNLQSEVKTLKAIKKDKPPRISAFITGGMDFIATQPIIQSGGEVRMFGPVSLVGMVQASGDKVKDADVKGVVAIRFNFK